MDIQTFPTGNGGQGVESSGIRVVGKGPHKQSKHTSKLNLPTNWEPTPGVDDPGGQEVSKIQSAFISAAASQRALSSVLDRAPADFLEKRE